MTNTEKLQAAGYQRVRTADECGEAITTRSKLIGLACEKKATWTKVGQPGRCAQHALLFEESASVEPEQIEDPKGFTVGQYVQQIEGADVGARGIITAIVEPTHFFSDGSAADGAIRVTYHGIRYPRVNYRPGSADRYIKVIPKTSQLLASE